MRVIRLCALALLLPGLPAAARGCECGTLLEDPAAVAAEEGLLAASGGETLAGAAAVRYLRDGVLEEAARLPAGARVEVPPGAAPVFHKFRDTDGVVKPFTSGFYPGIRILGVPAGHEAQFPQAVLDRLNATPGGLFLASPDVNSAYGGSVIPPLPLAGEPNATYLKYFKPDGRRHRNPYAERLRKRFGERFNREVPMASLPEAERRKWAAIHAEMVRIADRTRESGRRHLFLDTGSAAQDKELAVVFAKRFEETGESQVYGAWTIAVWGTAPSHGFGNVPCAEFVSETLRQAYAKAGYRFAEDFKGENYLLWSNTAAVVRLATALDSAGWVPWDPAEYRPVTGAPAMHAAATTPGHAYLIAGANGRAIVDNGSPKGRDLYGANSTATLPDLIGMMYDIGVFFLPPGIVPERW